MLPATVPHCRLCFLSGCLPVFSLLVLSCPLISPIAVGFHAPVPPAHTQSSPAAQLGSQNCRKGRLLPRILRPGHRTPRPELVATTLAEELLLPLTKRSPKGTGGTRQKSTVALSANRYCKNRQEGSAGRRDQSCLCVGGMNTSSLTCIFYVFQIFYTEHAIVTRMRKGLHY